MLWGEKRTFTVNTSNFEHPGLFMIDIFAAYSFYWRGQFAQQLMGFCESLSNANISDGRDKLQVC